MRINLRAVAIATALAVTGFVGLRAAEALHEANPPANVKMTQRSEAASAHGYSAVVKQVVPAVVNINSTKIVKAQANGGGSPDDLFRQFFGELGPNGPGQFGGNGNSRQFNIPQPQDQRERGVGSGVIVSSNGYILTNNHVVDGASEVTVTLHDKREFKAKVIGTDPRTDIAVIKIDASNLPTLTLADSSKVEVGDIVLAIGDPFGVGQTVTQGIVSATGRSGLGIEELEDFIQTDAAINPGNSGGALVDDEGHLIAINTAIVGNSGGNVGIGFAVPINIAKHDMDSILAHGKVDRGYLGVHIEDVTPALARAFHTTAGGALIGDISPNAPAANAGLKKGDIVTAINGETINDADQLKQMVGTLDPNTKISMKVMRDGRPMDFNVVLGEFPSNDEHASNALPSGNNSSESEAIQGVTVESLTPDIAQQLKLPASTKGVVVDKVNPSSDAAEAGLQQGDVIQEVNHQAVTTAQEFHRAMSSVQKDTPVLLLVNRGGNTAYVAIS
ncbi:MAG TPA: DegQ family serine endoprotease [Bryobacteraceae bacterium]|jgi:serine protease Do